MKIQCNACEAAEASVLCCADEAALCVSCDEEVHAANKLASKHQRVPLNTASSQMPKCDICQETAGFFFCLEDRALLCRKCDMAIHTANQYVSSHQRFLLTGVKVGLEASESGPSSSKGNSKKVQHSSPRKSSSSSRKPNKSPLISSRSSPAPMVTDYSEALPCAEDIRDFRAISGGSATANYAQWQMDDFLGLTDFSNSFLYPDDGSPKADSGKHGESDSSAILRSSGEDDENEYLAVPEMPSPPTASGLFWPRKYQNRVDGNAFVPDVGCAGLLNQHRDSLRGGGGRKRRRC